MLTSSLCQIISNKCCRGQGVKVATLVANPAHKLPTGFCHYLPPQSLSFSTLTVMRIQQESGLARSSSRRMWPSRQSPQGAVNFVNFKYDRPFVLDQILKEISTRGRLSEAVRLTPRWRLSKQVTWSVWVATVNIKCYSCARQSPDTTTTGSNKALH